MNDSSVSPIHVLVRLSGPRRGQSQHLHADTVELALDGDGHLEFGEEITAHHGRPLGHLSRKAGGYEIGATAGTPIWVNGEPAQQQALESGDVIEIGDQRHVLRYREYAPGSRGYKSMRQAFSDCVECARHSRSFLDRLGILVLGTLYEMTTQIRPAYRVLLLGGFSLAVVALGLLWFQNIQLQQRVNQQLVRIEELSTELKTEAESFTATDLSQAQKQYGDQLAATLARLEALERRLGARSRVIAEASHSVVFLQGAYGFVETETEKPLRVVVDAEGNPVPGLGQVQTSTEGEGPVFELYYTGTGFVATDEGHLITNRHVTRPWEADPNAQLVIQGGYTAAMRRFVAYLPGVEGGFDVQFLAAHPSADLALVQCLDIAGRVPPLTVRQGAPAIGEDVIVLGYPTGMRALIARVDPDYMNGLMEKGEVSFWDLAQGLSAGGYIRPLATAGVIGQITEGLLVYDAETTHGGSGGPVLDLNGTVVAVNTAIVSEFGGSNLGVPAAALTELLDAQR